MTQMLSKKGQVTVPKAVRDHLGIAPGAKSVSGSLTMAMSSSKTPPPKKCPAHSRLRGIAGHGMSTDELMALLRGEPE